MTFISVANSYMRRTGGTIPLYFPDEFKRHFRMTRQTHELFTRAVMATLHVAYKYLLRSNIIRI